ncbi:WxcM-like domain-containing protein [Salmonella enterica]|uniref:dTDP-6-deoxy-3,4-keto-hexulose isomerase n=1 Tax=Salmonella enterica TaxID=28901 RepID=U3GKN4_SALER|nr:dTDP-6-deoxy-3,4-keto-hexulose isomerase [Salmonella enterica]EAT8922678.1 WxcM-like domain-containing protein [Salmonella enterica subsp. arizonae serovar 63:z4,z32:-]EAV6588800.1 WxcM-like domain-containing protein [Salmonella enterica subsp. arizonae serovar 63:z4,z23:-]EAV7066393.1 WxcM-like domain-containing protein [Salmonella enterica subsp. arizonae serovar 63:z36:-]EAM8643721.1 WxcM-like domain-containing protein [Salmonella enterica]
MNIEIIPFQKHGDERGMLVALEQIKNVPFEIKRIYYMFGTKQNVRRGFHAHKNLRQLAIAVCGQCTFLLDDGDEQKTILLNDPEKGLLIEPGIWHEMFDFSDDCILLVLASDIYDECDYIRDYDEFQEWTK